MKLFLSKNIEKRLREELVSKQPELMARQEEQYALFLAESGKTP